MSSFGKRLRKLRRDKGLSQAELAKKIGYKRSGSISNIESDKTPPDIQTLVKITDLLHADLHWLITGKPALNKDSERYANLVRRIAPDLHKYVCDQLKAL